MDDQRDDCGPSAWCVGVRGSNGADHTPRQASGSPGQAEPIPLGERAELRMRLAELSAVVDTIGSALRDARSAGLKVSPRHERVAAMAAAAADLLRALNRKLD